MSSTPKAPAGLAGRGRKFWREACAKYEFDRQEVELLVEVCRSLDRLDALDALVAEQGQTVTGSTGQTVLHPGIAEARQQRIVLARLVKALAIPEGSVPAGGPAVDSATTEKARYAANARWKRG